LLDACNIIIIIGIFFVAAAERRAMVAGVVSQVQADMAKQPSTLNLIRGSWQMLEESVNTKNQKVSNWSILHCINIFFQSICLYKLLQPKRKSKHDSNVQLCEDIFNQYQPSLAKQNSYTNR
jgi:hypothetical protein